jgi:hypothetical protein
MWASTYLMRAGLGGRLKRGHVAMAAAALLLKAPCQVDQCQRNFGEKCSSILVHAGGLESVQYQ